MGSIVKLFKEMDWSIVAAVILLLVIGVLFIYSSGITSTGELVSNEYLKQIIWASSGMLIMILAATFDLKRVKDHFLLIYILSVILLVFTFLFGKTVNGARSWLGIAGEYGIQPSELMKITTAMYLARYLDTSSHEPSSIKRFALSFSIIALPMLLILIQPDFGTALVFIPIYLFMAYAGGINRRYLVFFVLTGALTIVFTVMPLWQRLIADKQSFVLRVFYDKPYFYYTLGIFFTVMVLSFLGFRLFKKKYYYWAIYTTLLFLVSMSASELGHKLLKDYQIMRLVVFIDPSIDPLGSGWNILQSITAIGSGGFVGKGFLKGTQSHYRYLPQQSTDFIFSIISEEMGFLGGLLVFALFLYILVKLSLIIKTQHSITQASFVSGMFGIIFFHFIINAGMAMGVMPITGIPLLFLSYGGSSLWAICLGLGLCLGIGARKFES